MHELRPCARIDSNVMSIRYDPGVIVDFAERLYAQARNIEAIYAVIGAVVGGAGGIAFGLAIGGWAVALLLASLGVVSVAFFGLVIGRARAFSLRLQAQSALCQVQLEANTRSTRIESAR